MRTPRIAIGLGLGLALAACGGDSTDKPRDATPPEDAAPDAPELPRCANPVSGSKISFRDIGRVVGAAMISTSPPGDLRLFVVEQRGAIRIFKDEQLQPEPFLDLSADNGGPVLAGGENGLLGLAFHPAYATNGQFYIYFTRREAGDGTYPQRNVVARCQRSAADPDRAEPTCTEILAIRDRFANHNGGMMEFGDDGYLYIGTGDGGDGGDPDGNAQSLADGSPTPRTIALLGKMLRLDVDHPAGGREYGIPSDNPFANGGGPPEVFMLGLRNPWRWSFDRGTGDLWIGDVGQDTVEELTVLPPAQQKGANLGWDMYEGDRCFTPPCSPAGKVFPQDTRLQTDGWESIIAGQTYRGSCFPDLVGWHFYTDYARGGLVKARLLADGQLEILDQQGSFPQNPTSIHADARGEQYMTTISGRVYRLEASP
ncbi:MAG: PQQ-dependent sugar dehydrogenase [Kofleriaceae bacterium]